MLVRAAMTCSVLVALAFGGCGGPLARSFSSPFPSVVNTTPPRFQGCGLEVIHHIEPLDPESVTYGPACMRVNADVQSSLAFAATADAIRTSAFALDRTDCQRERTRHRTITRMTRF